VVYYSRLLLQQQGSKTNSPINRAVLGRGRKLISRNPINLIVGWGGQFLFFVVTRQFSQAVGEWRENQILIPNWTYFHCPGATLLEGAIETVSLGTCFILLIDPESPLKDRQIWGLGTDQSAINFQSEDNKGGQRILLSIRLCFPSANPSTDPGNWLVFISLEEEEGERSSQRSEPCHCGRGRA